MVDARVPKAYTLIAMLITSATFIKGITGNDAILHDKYPQIAFVGRSNVGKSTLLNSLAGRGIAKTGKKQGKTTEINLFLINEKFYFVDLPGYGFAQGGHDKREMIREMILGYLTSKGKKPQTIAVILDAKIGLTDFDRDMLEILRAEGHHYVLVLNKIDKLTQKEASDRMKETIAEVPEADIVTYSSENKKGTNLLLQTLLGK